MKKLVFGNYGYGSRLMGTGKYNKERKLGLACACCLPFSLRNTVGFFLLACFDYFSRVPFLRTSNFQISLSP